MSRPCIAAFSILILVGSISGIIITAILVGVSYDKGCDPISEFNISVTVTTEYTCRVCHSWKSPNCCNGNFPGCYGTVTYTDSTCSRSQVFCESQNQTRINAIDIRNWSDTYKYIGIMLGMILITVLVVIIIILSCIKFDKPKPSPDMREKEL